MDLNLRTSSLSKLLVGISYKGETENLPDLLIRQVTGDSRKVVPGALFVACPGEAVDGGHDFIENAVAKGALAVVGEKKAFGIKVPYFQVENSRLALAFLSAAFFDHPARKMTMIGITGTDGKTTTANLLFQILKTAGYKTGLISTVNAVIGDFVLDTGFHVTTPDAPDVQQYLASMYESGITHVVLETTSHGWAQFRVDACEFDIGIITNITHEHLDYHGSFEKYRDAKARLFFSLTETPKKKKGNIRLAILNLDDPSYEFLKEVSKCKVISYSTKEKADIYADKINLTKNGLQFDANILKREHVLINSNLVGEFNISNCLAALSASVIGLGIDPDMAAKGISMMTGVPGRMERIESGQRFIAVIDFAHTPNALKVALQTARKMTGGKIIAIFGSAGLRDREKRRLMAETSLSLADLSIFTAEDPRTESLDQILYEMKNGAIAMNGVLGKNYWLIPDRGEAMRKGIGMAEDGDLVICCGKGHEQSMCFGTTEYAWDDRIALKAALAELLGIDGPEMPYLPTQDSSGG
jgi:UDP-N-acetylmuramoyl-L-alanyl-D-glutamate--2,6-diaminopimelate ligase